MPIGSSMVIPYIVEQLYPPPEVVLDVGIGYGMNGALVRQYSFGGQEMNRYKQQFLLGIEPFEKYRTPLWDCDDFRKLGFKIAWDGTPQRGQMMIVAVYKNGEVE